VRNQNQAACSVGSSGAARKANGVGRSGPLKNDFFCDEQPDVSTTNLDSGRLPARWSVILVFACFVSTCVGSLFDAKWGGSAGNSAAFWIGNSLGLLSLFGSIGLGLLGIARGWRNKNDDTIMIAGIGIFLASGMLGLIAWGCYLLIQRGR
jgi:hypothetical protein